MRSDTGQGVMSEGTKHYEPRSERLWKLNARVIPRLRAVGIAVGLILASIWDFSQDQALAVGPFSWLLAVVLGYLAISTFVLRKFYGRTGSLDLGVVFLCLDLPIFLFIIDYMGPSVWWLSALLLCRVADQTTVSFARSFGFLNYATVLVTAYLGYLSVAMDTGPG